MQPFLIDTHAHIDGRDFMPTISTRCSTAPQRPGFPISSPSGPTWNRAVRRSSWRQQYDHIFCAVGIHPHDAVRVTEKCYDIIRELARRQSEGGRHRRDRPRLLSGPLPPCRPGKGLSPLHPAGPGAVPAGHRSRPGRPRPGDDDPAGRKGRPRWEASCTAFPATCRWPGNAWRWAFTSPFPAP